MEIVISKKDVDNVQLEDTGYISHIRGMYVHLWLVACPMCIKQFAKPKRIARPGGQGREQTSDTCTYLLFDWKPNLDKIDRFIQQKHTWYLPTVYGDCA